MFLGKAMTQTKNVSAGTAEVIDLEVRKIIDAAYAKAKKILEENLDILHSMKDALMKYETLDASQIEDLMKRREVRPPKGWDDDPTSGLKSVDDSGGQESANKKDKKTGSLGDPLNEH